MSLLFSFLIVLVKVLARGNKRWFCRGLNSDPTAIWIDWFSHLHLGKCDFELGKRKIDFANGNPGTLYQYHLCKEKNIITTMSVTTTSGLII